MSMIRLFGIRGNWKNNFDNILEDLKAAKAAVDSEEPIDSEEIKRDKAQVQPQDCKAAEAAADSEEPIQSEEIKRDKAQVQPQDLKAAMDSNEHPEEDAVQEILQCKRTKECGHQCTGAKGEEECLPCLDPSCLPDGSRLPPKDDLCSICYTSELGEEACVQLGCNHVFHANCVHQLLKHRWNTLKISFAFMACPSCKQEISEDRCFKIRQEIAEIQNLRASVEKIALVAAEDISAIP